MAVLDPGGSTAAVAGGGGARAWRGAAVGGSLFSSVGRWTGTVESHVGSSGKTTATPSGAVYLLGGVVTVSSHSGQLRGCVRNTVVAWPAAVCFGNCQRCHGGLAGSNHAGVPCGAMVARLEAPGCFLCCWSLSLAGGDGREWRAHVDVPI